MRKTNIARSWFGLALAAGLGAGFPALAPAQFVPPASTTPRENPLAGARKQVTAARIALNRANVQVESVRKRVEFSFARTNPGYAAAQRAYDKAESDEKFARKAAMEALAKNPDYEAAYKTYSDAKTKRDALQADSKSDPDAITALINIVLVQKEAMADLEKTAADGDPKVLAADQRLADAKQQLDDYKGKLDDAYRADPEYAQATQTKDAATQQLAQAEAQLQQQAKQQAAAAEAAAKAKAAAAAQQNNSGGGAQQRPGGR